MAQIVNYTIGVGAKPVLTLVNAIPSDIVYDLALKRVWFLENNSLAYYSSTAPPGNMPVEQTFLCGSPQYMTINNTERNCTSPLCTNPSDEYDPVLKTLC